MREKGKDGVVSGGEERRERRAKRDDKRDLAYIYIYLGLSLLYLLSQQVAGKG